MTLRAAVFASGRGSNFEVLADHTQGADWTVAVLVSDRPDAPALDRARRRGIPVAVVPVKDRAVEDVGEETLGALREAAVDLCLLAGYLRLVPPRVVEAFRGRVLNVHPALLPAFGGKGMYGLHVHRAVLEAGVRVTGPTVHFVDERYDRGRILAQWPVPVMEGDTPEGLAARVTAVEHELYPAAVDELARALSAGREPRTIPQGEVGHPRFHLRFEPEDTGRHR
ncbi:MAG: phosphoribosylglycinamide formyltransferase [Gemmatimonadota bacterium]